MLLFRKYFEVSTGITSALLLLAVVKAAFSLFSQNSFYTPWELAANLIGFVLIGILPIAPFRIKGGFEQNRRFAIGVSVFLTLLFGGSLVAIFSYFVETCGGEGPKGEGAPGAFIFAMVLFAALFVCPWLLTALRGVVLWSSSAKKHD